jgi:uncharacterized SAM-binding protein YcdF (DUF218 family)
MNGSWVATILLSALLLPPLNLLLVALAGYLLRRRWPRLGPAIGMLALFGLLTLCTGFGAELLSAPLEQRFAPLQSARGSGAQAIVVLGGGRTPRAPEYGDQDIPSTIALGRLRYAARLHRETGLPVLVTGGSPGGSPESEAVLMARVLRDDFSVPVKWLETRSDNTAQNALFSAQLLKQANVQKVLLVTDAVHMPRAEWVFAQTGLTVVAAPTALSGRQTFSFLSLVPSGAGLMRSHYAMHEWVGMAWYRLRY